MKRTLQKVTPLVALAVVLSFAASGVEAAPIALASGTPYQGLAITAAQDQGSTNPGTLLAQLTSPYSINAGQIIGSVVAAVYQNASGFLDFYYQVSNASGSTSSISGINASSFGAYSTSVAFYSNASVFGGLFAAPSANTAPRSADRFADGSAVNFWFGPPFGSNRIDPGQTSSILMISTNAHGWSFGTSLVQNGSPTSFAVVQSLAVPEPASVGLALFGFAVLAGYRRRQK